MSGKKKLSKKGITWKNIEVKVSKLIPYQHNPRIMDDDEKNILKDSIDDWGYADVIVVNQDWTIISGHQRHSQLLELGKEDEMIDVRYPNRQLKEEELKELLVLLNGPKAKWDKMMLRDFFPVDRLPSLGIKPWEMPQITIESQLVKMPISQQDQDSPQYPQTSQAGTQSELQEIPSGDNTTPIHPKHKFAEPESAYPNLPNPESTAENSESEEEVLPVHEYEKKQGKKVTSNHEKYAPLTIILPISHQEEVLRVFKKIKKEEGLEDSGQCLMYILEKYRQTGQSD